ncbi:MAG: prepilin-type N-terminal cleavage/methylation domain-containing protein [Gammaproteobacteria bacterium]|nr:prepilin-type N-terminal cleavage/methylation domain-containing protein [Gammaproteobacteria bacterium]
MRPQGFTLLELMFAITVAALMAAIAFPLYSNAIQKARIGQAIVDMSRIDGAMERFRSNDPGDLPPNLAAIGMDTLRDPWGNPYQYLNIEAGANLGKVRKDRNLVPINTDFDLYSLGKDGLSRPPLTARQSQDDIIRAGNGSYMGIAKDF